MPDTMKISEVAPTSQYLAQPLRTLDQFAAEQALAVKERATRANAGWRDLSMSFAELMHKFVNDDGVSGSMSREDHAEALELLRRAGW